MRIKSKTIDHKQERDNDLNEILNSDHPRRVVVAGPGTGKSYLFEEVIKKEKLEGKTKFLAITFIGKLGDTLADDLSGLADTLTLHGFSRRFVLDKCPKGWEYYPRMRDIISEDLDIRGIKEFNIGDKNYQERTKYYKAVGDDDVVYYALQICKKDNKKIPTYDLILIDEFQDFNEIESEFIDLLATKNRVLIVGDDDQALYEFKGYSPRFIREKFDKANTYFESHTLRFCSRCTRTIIAAFHNIVNYYDLNNSKSKRIDKEYICYEPGKKEDSDLNPKILISQNTEIGRIPYIIKDELGKILQKQKIKSVLIIGEARSCSKLLFYVAKTLKKFGFKNVDYRTSDDRIFSFKQSLVDGYKILSKGNNPLLAWRLLIVEIEETKRKKIILNNYSNSEQFILDLPDEFKEVHKKNADVLEKILNKPPYKIKQIADSSIEKLKDQLVVGKRQDRQLLVSQLIVENNNLPRPLGNLDITVCNTLGSKGLGADVVFLIGFDQGKLPSKNKVTDSEIYQMLVALTRAKKRIYFINTIGTPISQFINSINKELYEEI